MSSACPACSDLSVSYFIVAGYYNADCMLENPYYLDPIDDCYICEKVKEIKDLTGKSVKKMKKYVENSDPFVIRVSIKTAVLCYDCPKKSCYLVINNQLQW